MFTLSARNDSRENNLYVIYYCDNPCRATFYRYLQGKKYFIILLNIINMYLDFGCQLNVFR